MRTPRSKRLLQYYSARSSVPLDRLLDCRSALPLSFVERRHVVKLTPYAVAPLPLCCEKTGNSNLPSSRPGNHSSHTVYQRVVQSYSGVLQYPSLKKQIVLRSTYLTKKQLLQQVVLYNVYTTIVILRSTICMFAASIVHHKSTHWQCIHEKTFFHTILGCNGRLTHHGARLAIVHMNDFC